MILTDYYRFEKKALKSKLRMDCTASTGSYPELEEKRASTHTPPTAKRDETRTGSLVVYCVDVPESYGGNAQRKAGKAITIKGKNLSSVYVPDVERNLAYGDSRGTDDALLFVFSDLSFIDGRIKEGGVIELFVARGKSHSQIPLYNLLSDGALDEEMERLRKQAKIEE